MYSVKPIGINTKDNDRDVPDGSLLESINMQWRDGAFKPIPERLISDIDTTGYSSIILHKVGDENQINVLGFSTAGGLLNWFGTIADGAYAEVAPTVIAITKTPELSFTILNGLVYFMGDGSTAAEQYYHKLEFDQTMGSYKVYDMYKWKSLIPFFPYQEDIILNAPKNTYQAFSQCGIVLIRFALVLKSGEIVLHSPIYGYLLYGLNRSDAVFAKGDTIENIHTFVNLDLSFLDTELFEIEVSAINVYASTADYESKFSEAYSSPYSIAYLYKQEDIRGKLSKKAEDPFYLIKTIDAPSKTEKILLTAGPFDADIELSNATNYTYSKVDITSIAAGEIMPVDNFSYHKLYGRITSYNGRLVIKRPVTVLSSGHMRSLARVDSASNQAFSIITEDGTLNGVSYSLDKAIEFSANGILTRGILSYPDIRASLVGANNIAGDDMRMFKCRGNKLHNMACNYNIYSASENSIIFEIASTGSTKLKSVTNYCVYIEYNNSIDSSESGLVSYSVPIAEINGRQVFELPNIIDLTKNAYAHGDYYNLAVGQWIRVNFWLGTDFTIDNGGPGGVGRFNFNPYTFAGADWRELVLTYNSLGSLSGIVIPTITPTETDANTKYSSENRIQFSQSGEFKVWPAVNSYRIGEGKLMNLGIGSVNPSESQIISPIMVGTTDGIYTINLDPGGSIFIASITKTRSLPMISEEILEIDNNILFVSDQGLMVFSDGDIQNLTGAYFPQQGNGNYPTMESVFQGYNLLTLPFFGEGGNIYLLDDIVTYMRGSLLAFDGRRNTVWCSNPAYPFSMVYSLDSKQWGMSTIVFNEKQELFSILNTAEGEIYSRFLVKSASSNNLLLLSGEDPTKEVFYHVLTRPIKFQNTDNYKALTRMISRSMLKRNSVNGYLSLGLWGSQEVNKYKKAFALALKKDDRAITFPDNTRYHIPVTCRKGKYKTITILQAGKGLPESYISSFDFDVFLVDNNKMR